MELKLGNSCGSCIHSNRPKTPREHAAHYEVAKTERWCFKHNQHITRESSCDDHEGVSRAAKTAFTRLIKYNARRKAILELAELMTNKPVITRDRIYFAKNNWVYYVYGNDLKKLNESNNYYHYSLRSKESSTDRKIKEIKEYLK
jgi:hypothetical protein